MRRPTAWIAWSSGKDSAWALHVVRQQGAVDVTGMLCTITEPFDRVSMHAVRRELVAAQAAEAGLPLHEVLIPAPCPNEVYEAKMAEAMDAAKAEGVTHVVFGDLFLEDVRQYRIDKLAGTGIEPLFPLWGRPTADLAREMLRGGLRARVTCIDPRKMPRELAGRELDGAFLAALPDGADPCAENGEFHTFAYAGPMFRRPIPIRVGENVERDGFVFTDVLPADE